MLPKHRIYVLGDSHESRDYLSGLRSNDSRGQCLGGYWKNGSL